MIANEQDRDNGVEPQRYLPPIDPRRPSGSVTALVDPHHAYLNTPGDGQSAPFAPLRLIPLCFGDGFS